MVPRVNGSRRDCGPGPGETGPVPAGSCGPGPADSFSPGPADSSGPALVHCTNGYPLRGDDPASVLEALLEHGVAVRERTCPGADLPIGLYLPASAAASLVGGGLPAFGARLRAAGLCVRTLNGFPFASFHTPGEPRRVYRPAWDDPRRVQQTLDLAEVLAGLLPDGAGSASISTLPVGWRSDPVDAAQAAKNLLGVARRLAERFDRTGVHLTVDLEPEPGCALTDSASAVRFFDRWLQDDAAREHLGACHDVCHAAVMFEDQADALGAFRAAGIRVNKVQVSNAPEAAFGELEPADAAEARSLLQALPGERSLRQTSIRKKAGAAEAFYDDLLEAFADNPAPSDRWRVHHHLPLTLDRFGPLNTTRGEVGAALRNLADHGESPMLETETYTWTALPAEMRAASLAEGLAGELAWTQSEIDGIWKP